MVSRVLSATQAATRDRLIESCVAVASNGGYAAVGVREVAAAAGVSPATAYQYFGSKDHLLIETLMALGNRSTERVRSHQPPGAGPAERISHIFQRIMRQAAKQPLLYQALYRAYIAGHATVAELGGVVGFGPEQAAWIGYTLRAGDLAGHDESDLDDIAGILSALFLGAMVSLVAGRDVDDVVGTLDSAVRRILPDS